MDRINIMSDIPRFLHWIGCRRVVPSRTSV